MHYIVVYMMSSAIPEATSHTRIGDSREDFHDSYQLTLS